VQHQLQGDVIRIYASACAFAALRNNGAIVTWGNAEYGGDSNSVQVQLQGEIAQISSTHYALQL